MTNGANIISSISIAANYFSVIRLRITWNNRNTKICYFHFETKYSLIKILTCKLLIHVMTKPNFMDIVIFQKTVI